MKALFRYALIGMLLASAALQSNSGRAEAKRDSEQSVKQLVSEMTLEEKIGQMLMPDFRNWKKKGSQVRKD